MKANNHDTDDKCIRTCCRGSVSIFALPLHVLIQTSPAHKLSFDSQRKDRLKSRAARLQAYSRPPSSPIYQFPRLLHSWLEGSTADHHRERQRYYRASLCLCPCPLLPVHFRLRGRISPETRLLCTGFSLRTLLVTMFSLAAEHPVLAALGVLFVGWVARFLWKGYQVRKTFHGQVDTIWTVTFVAYRRLSVL
jgi:hypothetical protein